MQPWMKPPQSEFHLLMSCQDQVTKLPDTGKSLAISDICPTGMFQVGESMLGIQGHPEFSSEYSESLMRGRLAKIGKETVERGIASLRIPPDRELISSWIQEFLAMKNG
jgi:GMP synthase (glutamine-hydrolysing)